MRLLTVSLALCCYGLLSACQKGGDQPAAPETPAAAPADTAKAPTAPADTAKAPGEPAAPPAAPAPGPEVAQCQKILDACWKAVQPALPLLQIDPAAAEEPYRKKGEKFLEACKKLTPEQRECLEKAENPIAAIDPCKVNEGKEVNDKLFAPSLQGQIKLFEPEALPEKDAAALQKAMAGVWVNDWKKLKTVTTWTIKPTGEVTQKAKREGKPDPGQDKQFKISFTHKNRMKVQWSETSSQDYMFLLDGKKVFYAGGNLAYGVFPMASPDAFVVSAFGDYVFFEKGKCQVVSDTGWIAEGKCKFEKAKTGKLFMVEYEFPGKLDLTGKPAKMKRSFVVAGKFLVDDFLAEAGKYVRK